MTKEEAEGGGEARGALGWGVGKTQESFEGFSGSFVGVWGGRGIVIAGRGWTARGGRRRDKAKDEG